MKRWTALLATAITLVLGIAADARDPFEDDPESLPLPAGPAPDPVAFVVPAGLYYVTDTYVGDVVATTGATTTYSTTTMHQSTGSYARVIDTVDTGSASAFDGAAFNGRGSLSDGRPLAGTYYENFVLASDGYVPVSIVFFQDDSETRRANGSASPSPAPTAAPRASASPSVVNMTAVPGTVAAASPGTVAATSSGAAVAGPSLRPRILTTPIPRILSAGIALAPDGPTLASAEVLRGRVVHFWPRAFDNGIATPLRSWRLVSAQPDVVSAASGAAEPLAAQWIQMPPSDVRWSLRFEIFTEIEPTRRLAAEISIAVRSPALID
jgi:hypothetical protein